MLRRLDYTHPRRLSPGFILNEPAIFVNTPLFPVGELYFPAFCRGVDYEEVASRSYSPHKSGAVDRAG